jgi:hypothetical protein
MTTPAPARPSPWSGAPLRAGLLVAVAVALAVTLAGGVGGVLLGTLGSQDPYHGLHRPSSMMVSPMWVYGPLAALALGTAVAWIGADRARRRLRLGAEVLLPWAGIGAAAGMLPSAGIAGAMAALTAILTGRL